VREQGPARDAPACALRAAPSARPAPRSHHLAAAPLLCLPAWASSLAWTNKAARYAAACVRAKVVIWGEFFLAHGDLFLSI